MKSLLIATAGALAAGGMAHAESVAALASAPTVSEVVVAGARAAPDIAIDIDQAPTTAETVTAADIATRLNAATPEDALRYLPNLLVRQRHIGDTQSPVATRTSGVGASARSLIYVDGILISSLIGNNNTSASPKWGLVSPDAVEQVEALYGPFAAAYAGNSIGAVIQFTTRSPQRFEATATLQGGAQAFRKYGDQMNLGTGRVAATVGDRIGRFSFRLGWNHLNTNSQPLTYATAAIPATTNGAGTPVAGGLYDANRAGQPIVVLGALGIEHQVQDNLSGRLTFDLTPALTAAYSFGLFHNDDRAKARSDLTDAAGRPVYAGALNLDGRAYNLGASTFSSGVYRLKEDQLAQGLSLASHGGGLVDFELVGTRFDYLNSRQRAPTGALPSAYAGGTGSTTSLDDTGWSTLDAKAILRPFGADGPHLISLGAHSDQFKLNNPRYALADWISGPTGAVQSFSRGKTRTEALWLQDLWTLAPSLTATLGGRWERWRAFDGLNYSASPALNAAQPEVKSAKFSPKGVLAWSPSPAWTFKASLGVAYRFPTVTELYQAVTTGTQLTVPNPNLRPEKALSAELSAERAWSGGGARLSLFNERIDDALLSQTAPLVPGSGALFSYVQNVDRTRARGIELVGHQSDLLAKGFDLEAWVTYVDAEVVRDTAFAAAAGKRLPQLPRLRASVAATWRPAQRLALTLAGRYSDRSFATIDNSDPHADSYTGFGAWFVMDARAQYRVNDHLTAALGVNNLNNRRYFVFHPFPQRTVIAELKASY